MQQTLGAITLNVAEGPRNGPPLVLLHGLTYSCQSFRPLLDRLMQQYHVLLPDLRGHGASSRGNRYRVSDYAEDVRALLSGLPEAAILYGHSIGALAALAVAARTPVPALVLEDPPLFYRHTAVSDTAWYPAFAWAYELTRSQLPVDVIRARLQAQQPAANPQALQRRAAMLKNVDPEAIRIVLDHQHMQGFELESAMAAIDCPTLLLQADPARGAAMTDTDAAHALSHLRNATLQRIERSGHLIHASRPEAIQERLHAFLPC